MKTIWKYELAIVDNQYISIPKKAKFLSVKTQRNKIVIYFIVNTNNSKEKRLFHVVGTGHLKKYVYFNDKMFLGSALLSGGSLVYHIFEG